MKQKTRRSKFNEEKGPLKMEGNDNTANRNDEERVLFFMVKYCKLGKW